MVVVVEVEVKVKVGGGRVAGGWRAGVESMVCVIGVGEVELCEICDSLQPAARRRLAETGGVVLSTKTAARGCRGGTAGGWRMEEEEERRTAGGLAGLASEGEAQGGMPLAGRVTSRRACASGRHWPVTGRQPARKGSGVLPGCKGPCKAQRSGGTGGGSLVGPPPLFTRDPPGSRFGQAEMLAFQASLASREVRQCPSRPDEERGGNVVEVDDLRRWKPLAPAARWPGLLPGC